MDPLGFVLFCFILLYCIMTMQWYDEIDLIALCACCYKLLIDVNGSVPKWTVG